VDPKPIDIEIPGKLAGKKEDDGLGTGAIVGIVIAGVVVIIVIILAVVLGKKGKGNRGGSRQQELKEPADEDQSVPAIKEDDEEQRPADQSSTPAVGQDGQLQLNDIKIKEE